MARILLNGGANAARSIIAGATRSLNLFPERNEAGDDPPVPVTQYPTPGLLRVYSHPTAGAVRALYWASNDLAYAVVGRDVVLLYTGASVWTGTILGTITPGTTPVVMKDNGTVIVLVDGTVNGYTINLLTNAFAPIVSAGFYGGDSVDYIDTYFVINKKFSQIFYLSDSLATTFNPLNFASKVGSQDWLLNVMCVRREIWLFGTKTTEIWTDSGAPDFPFAIMSGAFIEHGIAAIYSLAKIDTTPFWLSQDRGGNTMVLRGEGYSAKRISTHALEYHWSTYIRVNDAVGFCYQMAGHSFYAITFVSADETWAYDIATDQWHQWAFMDAMGGLHASRVYCAASMGYVGVVFGGDSSNGAIYRLDLGVGTDDGNPIKRLRTFPHLVKDGNRILHRSIIVDMETGDAPAGTAAPVLTLRFSDDHGKSWGNPVYADFGAPGQYNESVQFNRMGLARDRIYEISWVSPVFTALNGAFLETTESAS